MAARGRTAVQAGVRREPEAAAGELFDLIVVGGGIHGIMLALEATRRRLRPLLLERADFGGGATAGALRLLPEEPASLGALLRARGAADERLWWWQHFPAQVEPLPVVMPLHEGQQGPDRRPLHRLERHLRRFRKDGAPAALAGPRALSRDELIEICPHLTSPDLTGGLTWTGLGIPSATRLCLEALRWGCMTGATALNYVEVTDLAVLDGAVSGVDANDRVGGARYRFQAPIVIVASGGQATDFIGRSTVDEPPVGAWSALLERKPAPGVALAWQGVGTGGTTAYLVPSADGALYGPMIAGEAAAERPDWLIVRLILD
ncbi:MAG: FAD-dependent oxidoreductase, partial [Geminicoccaceae bacterium]|nr:FAD-dependent oxidoreductase [Geminicoccaceae bacterium]